MLKSIVIALLLCATFLPVRGQTSTTPVSSNSLADAYQFCVLVLSTDNGMLLDYGQDERNAAPNTELAQDDAKIRKMASLATALTYLSSRGWEYLSANSMTINSRPTWSSEIVYGWSTNYLLRRRLP